jgi:peptidoglycan/xylan/chitin deacetylase (PgdA/CDA1 family)
MMLEFKRFALRLCKAFGLFAIAQRLTGADVRILCYHGTWRTDDGFAGDSMFIQPQTFARRLDLLTRMGFAVVPLADAISSLASGQRPRRLTAVITIDDGWYGTYADMVPTLEARGMPATLYSDTGHLEYGGPIPHVFARYLRRIAVRSESAAARLAFDRATNLQTPLAARYAALLDYARETGVDPKPYLERRSFSYMTATELRDASRRGLDVQLHTHNHSLHDFSQTNVEREIDQNRAAIIAILGGVPRPLVHFCYPSGVTHPAASQHLRSCNIRSATTTRGGLANLRSDLYDIPRLLDGDNMSDIEFEAQLSGFIDIVRAALGARRH